MNPLQVTTIEARSNFSEIINRATYGQQPVTLTRRGKAVAAVISPDDLRILTQAKKRYISSQLVQLQETTECIIRAGRVPDVRILGINATGPLHQGLEIIADLLAKGGTLKLLLLNPLSPVFTARMDREHDAVGRLQAELLASFYILMTIMHKVPSGDIEVRLHNKEPDRSLILVNCDDPDGVAMENPYPDLKATRGLIGKMYTWVRNIEGEKYYNEAVDYFNTLWEGACQIDIVFPEDRLDIRDVQRIHQTAPHTSAPEKSLGLWPFIIK